MNDPGPGAPELAVFGEWNTANLGDRAIGRAARAFFAECGWRATPYALGALCRVAGADDGRAPDGAFHALRLAGASGALKRRARAVRQRYRMLWLLGPLSRAQAIVVGGGGLLGDANLHFPQSLAAVATLARALGKPLLCLGCGASGPWSERGARLIGRFVAACRVVAVRDARTAARLRALGASPPPALFGDFCLAERDLRDDWPTDSRTTLALNVYAAPDQSGTGQERYENAMVRLGRSLGGHDGRKLCVFTTGTSEDEAPARRVHARLPGASLHLPSGLDGLETLMRGGGLVVASRLHAAILALARGAAVLGCSPTSKLTDYLETMGLREYAFGPDDVDALARCVAREGCARLRAGQVGALRRAPVWAGRADARRALEALASGAAGAARVDVTG